MKRGVTIWLAVWLLALLLPRAATAHRPLWGEGEQREIPNLETSFALYEDLARDEVDRYTFEGRAGQPFHAGINVPTVAGLEQYGVAVALLGPGLPTIEPAALPQAPASGQGALFFPSVVSEDFFEPFTQTNYWGRQSIDLTLPETGRYTLLIWQPEGVAGKYVLDTGREERFGPADLFVFPLWWWRVHGFFGHTPLIVGALLGTLGAVGALGLWRRRAAQRPAGGDVSQRKSGSPTTP